MKSHALVTVCTLLGVVLGCDDQVDPDDIPKSQILHVYSEAKASLVANARDTAVVVARIPEASDARTIAFFSTKGRFVFSNDKAIKASADSVHSPYRFARVQLVSDSTAGTAYVTATIAEFRETIAIPFHQ